VLQACGNTTQSAIAIKSPVIGSLSVTRFRQPSRCRSGRVESLKNLFCVSVYHLDHSTQPALIRVRNCRKAERLFRPGNWIQHLRRSGDGSLGCNKYQPDHRTWREECGRYNEAASHGNNLQLPRNPLAVQAAKHNGNSTRKPQALRTPFLLGLEGLAHSHPLCFSFPKNEEITEGLVLFPRAPQHQADSLGQDWGLVGGYRFARRKPSVNVGPEFLNTLCKGI
jgi:hypothetical protein